MNRPEGSRASEPDATRSPAAETTTDRSAPAVGAATDEASRGEANAGGVEAIVKALVENDPPLGPPSDGPPPARDGDNPIDRALGALRFHHAFNAAVLFVVGALVVAAPELTLLPLYLALVARRPCLHLQNRFGLSFGAAALATAAGAFAVLIATVVALALPLALQALKLDATTLEEVRPSAERLALWARSTLEGFGVDVAALDARFDFSAEGVAERILGATDVGALLSVLTQAVVSPVVLVGLAFLVVFMASYALAYSTKLRDESRRFIRLAWPPRTVWLVERLIVHAQHYGAEVMRGYSWMVLVLGLFYFLVYLGALAAFPSASLLPPLIVVALIVLSGVIGAIPGLGAKLLLAIGTVAGLGVGVVAAFFTGDIGLGFYIFVAVVLVTGFESKFGTPNALGRALGVNSALILFIAIATVAAFGVIATLWTVFVVLPLFVAAVRVLVEIHGEPDMS